MDRNTHALDGVPMTADIEAALLGYLETEVLRGRGETPKADDQLLESGLIDSMELMRLVMFIEEHFGVSVPDDRVLQANFETVRAIAAMVESLR